MAGEQDIVSLGLNISSFDAKKKKILTEYITLFDQLSKYDGKIFNPVMGDGLNKFNTSIAESSKLLEDMNSRMTKLNTTITEQEKDLAALRLQLSEYTKGIINNNSVNDKSNKTKSDENKINKNLLTDYNILRKALQDQANTYQQLYLLRGKYDIQTKAALSQYSATAGIINDIDKQLSRAGGGAAGFGRSLGTAFGYLRSIAYILPGIGIAGIFNVIFQAIDEAVSSLGLFNDKIEEGAKKTINFNKHLTEQITLYYELNKLRQEYVQNFGGDTDVTYVDKQQQDKIGASRGIAKDKLFPQEISTAELRLQTASDAVGGSVASEKELMEGLYSQMVAARDKIVEINNIRQKILSTGLFKEDDLKKLNTQAEAQKSNYDLAKLQYENSKERVKEFYEADQELAEKKAAYTKFQEDEDRKLKLETSKNEISVNIEKNKKVLADERSFHDKKEQAIRSNFSNEVSLNSANLKDVIDNISSTEHEKQIAKDKYETENQKASLKLQQDLQKNDTEFYQRKILALTEIKKDEIEQESIANERVFLNEKHSLKDRLDSYEDYIINKQKIKDLEYDLAIQKDASKKGGATSLTPEERQRIGVHHDTQQFNIQADAEKQTYEIVMSYLNLQLKEIKIMNDKERDINRDAYAKELSDNNERFKNKIFQYQAFKKNKEFIDKKYGVILTAEDEIKDDNEDIERTRKLYDELTIAKKRSDDQLRKKSGDLSDDKGSGRSTLQSERFYNEELGKNNAFNDAILKAKKELDDAVEKGENDKVKNARSRYEQLIQFEKEHAENKKRIEEGLWDLANKLINSEVENKLRAIQLLNQSRNEQFSLEEDAVQKSSLNAKDKAALDIQLTQQQLELNKQAALEERKIKQEAAIRDRDLAVAHVLWNTIESVSAALKLPPPAGEILAAERAILGGIEAAQILAVPIPSYADGTANHKGGFARYGEDGWELIQQPGKKPFIATQETISELDPGTKVIPLNKNHPEFDNKTKDESWEQTKFLAKQISKSNKEIKNIFKPTIIIDMGFENRKRQILGN